MATSEEVSVGYSEVRSVYDKPSRKSPNARQVPLAFLGNSNRAQPCIFVFVLDHQVVPLKPAAPSPPKTSRAGRRSKSCRHSGPA